VVVINVLYPTGWGASAHERRLVYVKLCRGASVQSCMLVAAQNLRGGTTLPFSFSGNMSGTGREAPLPTPVSHAAVAASPMAIICLAMCQSRRDFPRLSAAVCDRPKRAFSALLIGPSFLSGVLSGLGSVVSALFHSHRWLLAKCQLGLEEASVKQASQSGQARG
jgi:hypothetical protein